jgi:hypothetical protein
MFPTVTMNPFLIRPTRDARRWLALPFAALLCFPLATLAQEADLTLITTRDLQPIFNGTNLDGWIQRGGKAKYTVENGVIVGTTVKGEPNSFLCTQKEYGDFILELELKADESLNSGVQIRSLCFDHATTYDWGNTQIKIPAGRVHGYQIEVDHRPERRWSGGVYEEGRRGWLFDLSKNATAGAAFKFGEWNKYRIACQGGSIKTWINGVAAADLVDTATLSGFIALQVHNHDKAGLQVRFRNLRLQDLGRHEWKPMWDGQTFNGAHLIGKGDWKITDGAIHATNAKEEKEFGHLVTDQVFSDFTVRLKYKSVKGNSGLYFRIEEKGFSGVSGFQAEIDAEKDAGGLYETNGRAWVSQPAAADVKKWFRPQDWNTMTVSAHGKRITVDVNGYQSAELLDDPGRTEGRFALQVHGGQDVDVYFKDIEILE